MTPASADGVCRAAGRTFAVPDDPSFPGLLALLGLARDPADRGRAAPANAERGCWRPIKGTLLPERTLRVAVAQIDGWLRGDADMVCELDPIPPEGLARRRGEDVRDVFLAELDRRRV